MGQLREMYAQPSKLPATHDVAGRIFEAMIHREFSGSWQDSGGPTLDYFRMTSNNENPPTFCTVSLSGGDPQSPVPAPLSANAKRIIKVNLNLAGPPSGVTLDEDRYCIPTGDDNPLFGSFIVHHDSATRTLVISIIQVVISAKQEGSTWPSAGL